MPVGVRGVGAVWVVLGVGVGDLPWQLQHTISWQIEHAVSGYRGNPNISRCDPADWGLKNPWARMNLAVGICRSKRGVNARRKAQGLPTIRGKAAWEAFSTSGSRDD